METESTYTRMFIGTGKHQIYFNVDEKTEEVWLDIKYLPEDCYFCALFDGVSIMKDNVGKGKKAEDRIFLPLDWIINGWGGPKHIIDALKKHKKKFKKELKDLKKEVNENK